MDLDRGIPRPKLLTVGLFIALFIIAVSLAQPLFREWIENNRIADGVNGALFAFALWPIVTRLVRRLFAQQ